MMWSEAFVIEGRPATKKTSQRIVRNKKTGLPFILPSSKSKGWEQGAILQLKAQWKEPASITRPVAVRALVYRDRRVGDWTGYMQAIGDALERSGVIANDNLIRHWDNSRLLVDKARPRVELTVTVTEEE